MATKEMCVIAFLIFNNLLVNVFGNIPHKRFEYKYSFKPPFLAQSDGSVPFWEYGGNAIASADSVRVAPSLKSQKGAIWTKNPTQFKWWEVDISFRITGRGRIGADGLAFWYTNQRGNYDGTVFGSSDKWVGLGIFFDSFDNDNKHNNPYIMAVMNDGTIEFDHANDGASQQLGGCLRDFRNKPYPTRAKIEYYMNTLTVMFHNGMTNNDNDMELCLRQENVHLPLAGYFGLSAATGGLADDHDAYHFLTSSLSPPGQLESASDQAQMNVEEQQKLAKEYQEYQQKLNKQKEQYLMEHPEARKEADDVEDWFETDNQRELRQIFSAQSQMFELMKDLHRKQDEIVGRQERTLSLIASPSINMQVPADGGASAAQHTNLVNMQQNHQVLISLLNELRGLANEINIRADNILRNQERQPTAQVQPLGYDFSTMASEIRQVLNDGFNNMKNLMTEFTLKLPTTSDNCANSSSVSLTIYLVVSILQLTIIMAFLIYREKQVAQAKKFY